MGFAVFKDLQNTCRVSSKPMSESNGEFLHTPLKIPKAKKSEMSCCEGMTTA